jgi:hypothetical protein
MPKEITSVQCEECKKLHSKDGRYIEINIASIIEHPGDFESDWVKQQKESINVNDVVVCNNDCLTSLLSLKNF